LPRLLSVASVFIALGGGAIVVFALAKWLSVASTSRAPAAFPRLCRPCRIARRKQRAVAPVRRVLPSGDVTS
jgi:hypothetical protein